MTVPNRPLTIRDYIDRASTAAGPRIQSGVGSGSETGVDFSRFLARSTLSDSHASNDGMTAADYLANPVQRPVRLSEPPGRTDVEWDTSQKKPEPGRAATSPVFSDSRALTEETAVASRPPGSGEKIRGSDRPGMDASRKRERIERSIAKAAGKYDLPAALIRGVIRAESNFDANAVSHAGAVGLMQLMPATADDLGVTNAFDIDQNIDGGSRYLKQMLLRFGGDVKLALAAYNAGPGTVEKYDGSIPYRETRHYVQRVIRFSGLTA
jgi:hypothetical protein